MQPKRLLNTTKPIRSKNLTSDLTQNSNNGKTNNHNEVNKDPETNTEDPSALVEVFPVDDTPFQIIKHDETYRITFGKYIISEPMKNRTECENLIRKWDWNFMVNLIISVVNQINKLKTN